MKQLIKIALFAVLFMGMSQISKAQLSDEEYNYVTMDLRGILNLTMTTNPQVDFAFKNITDYQQGITRFNATQLEVDATLSWDLFVYANSDTWTQVEAYSTNGNAALPAEILEIRSSVANPMTTENFDNFISLKGLGNSGVVAGAPAAATQFLAGAIGTTAPGTDSQFPGTAAGNPTTHRFRLDMRMVPAIPATFPNSTVAMVGPDYAQAGYYYLEVVYSLVEDL
ncbi:hypothetical protein [Carboxylicivirga sp. N1Y90]|uniref:hypothetical protein n=1 Tax=Carboxylicivirga fragile TaxID=3417571 RepID=UPI003D342445|nr:hypothetical protein [Marinilabiliaceae bacterium N1Y90]